MRPRAEAQDANDRFAHNSSRNVSAREYAFYRTKLRGRAAPEAVSVSVVGDLCAFAQADEPNSGAANLRTNKIATIGSRVCQMSGRQICHSVSNCATVGPRKSRIAYDWMSPARNFAVKCCESEFRGRTVALAAPQQATSAAVADGDRSLKQ